MATPTIDTKQIKVLEDFFKNLSAVDQKRVFDAGFRRAAKPLISKAKSNAPYRSGNLRKSIGSIIVKDDLALLVGAKQTGRFRGYHGHLVEDGTKIRRRRSGGSTGSMPATHFFEKAFNATSKEMYDSIEDSWRKEIDNLIVRTNKKAKK